MPLALRKSMGYGQGRDATARHAKTGVAIFLCDPHSPWRLGSNEHINGLIRQYLPKGTDLSIHSGTGCHRRAIEHAAAQVLRFQMFRNDERGDAQNRGAQHTSHNSITVLHAAPATTAVYERNRPMIGLETVLVINVFAVLFQFPVSANLITNRDFMPVPGHS
jgi:hypothetical protein